MIPYQQHAVYLCYGDIWCKNETMNVVELLVII